MEAKLEKWFAGAASDNFAGLVAQPNYFLPVCARRWIGCDQRTKIHCDAPELWQVGAVPEHRARASYRDRTHRPLGFGSSLESAQLKWAKPRDRGERPLRIDDHRFASIERLIYILRL